MSCHKVRDAHPAGDADGSGSFGVSGVDGRGDRTGRLREVLRLDHALPHAGALWTTNIYSRCPCYLLALGTTQISSYSTKH